VGRCAAVGSTGFEALADVAFRRARVVAPARFVAFTQRCSASFCARPLLSTAAAWLTASVAPASTRRHARFRR
jgi:hypothetical protein